jgi:hypothetical protein
MHAIIDLADQSSRMKDYYDLHRILKEEKYDPEVLQEAIIRTFENRHTPYDEISNEIWISIPFVICFV